MNKSKRDELRALMESTEMIDDDAVASVEVIKLLDQIDQLESSLAISVRCELQLCGLACDELGVSPSAARAEAASRRPVAEDGGVMHGHWHAIGCIVRHETSGVVGCVIARLACGGKTRILTGPTRGDWHDIPTEELVLVDPEPSCDEAREEHYKPLHRRLWENE